MTPADVGSSRGRPAHGAVGAYLAAGLGLGALAGVVWWAVVDLPSYTVGPDGRAATSERGLTELVASDAWFCVLGAIAGLLLGLLAWRRLRDLGWPVVLLGAGTALAAALVCWWVGTELGPGPFTPRLAAAQPGEVVPVALELRTGASLVVWPFLAVVPILLGSSLGRDEEEPHPPARPGAAPAEVPSVGDGR